MNISIVVPAHHANKAFERCLQGLAKAEPAPAELVVVPDGKGEGVREMAEAYGAIVLEPTRAPRGPAHARNRGAAATRGDILFFIDSDVVIYPDALGRVAATFEADPDLAALIGSYDDAPGAEGFLSQYRNLLHHHVHQVSSEDASTFWGACGAIRREVFTELGGFDERYVHPSVEDIELGYRLKRAGYKIRLCKTLMIKHLKHWSAVSMIRTDFFRRALPWTELILQDQRFSNDLNLRYEHRISVASTYMLLLTLAGAFWWPVLLFGTFASAVLLLVLNASLYRFFHRKCGFSFTLRAIPWHWIFYLYSGLAFGIGVIRHLARGGRRNYNPSVAAKR